LPISHGSERWSRRHSVFFEYQTTKLAAFDQLASLPANEKPGTPAGLKVTALKNIQVMKREYSSAREFHSSVR
jgi:hypothetical protein